MTMSPSNERQMELVMAVSDILSTILIGIPPFTIAVLLLRVGLDGLCKDFEEFIKSLDPSGYGAPVEYKWCLQTIEFFVQVYDSVEQANSSLHDGSIEVSFDVAHL